MRSIHEAIYEGSKPGSALRADPGASWTGQPGVFDAPRETHALVGKPPARALGRTTLDSLAQAGAIRTSQTGYKHYEGVRG